MIINENSLKKTLYIAYHLTIYKIYLLTCYIIVIKDCHIKVPKPSSNDLHV